MKDKNITYDPIKDEIVKVSEPAMAYALPKQIPGVDLLNHQMLMFDLINKGLSFPLFEAIVASSPYNFKEWSDFLGLPYRSLMRYKKNKEDLNSIYSERIIECARIFLRGMEVFGSGSKFKLWAAQPKIIFDGMAPLQLIHNSAGRQLISEELHKVDHGLFA